MIYAYIKISTYPLKCREITESKNPKAVTTKTGRKILLSKCAVCDSKKSKFFKQKETSRLLRDTFSNIPLVGPL